GGGPGGGAGGEPDADGRELAAKLPEVLDDAVVDERDASGGGDVGVGVAVGGHAVGRPAGVRDAAGGVGALAAAERRLEVGELAGVLLDVHRGAETLDLGARPVEDQRDPRRVVATVLESAQAVEHDVDGLALAYV